MDTDGARTQVEALLADHPHGRWLDQPEARTLLAGYRIPVRPTLPAPTEETAVTAAARVGYPVVLKATDQVSRHRVDLSTEAQLRSAYQGMHRQLGGTGGLVVEAMAPTGVAVAVTVDDDPVLGGLVSFGLGGVSTELLEDRAVRTLPLTDLDAAELVRSVRAAPLLFGYQGADLVDVPALEDLLLRVGRLAEDLPQLQHLELNPIVVSQTGLTVLRATLQIARPHTRPDLASADSADTRAVRARPPNSGRGTGTGACSTAACSPRQSHLPSLSVAAGGTCAALGYATGVEEEA